MTTTTTWLHAVSGNFNTTADWSSGVPNIFEDAELSAIGTYTVTSSQSNAVLGLELNAKTTLAITEGTFIDANGTDGLDDAGTIAIDNNTIFLVGLFGGIMGAIPLDVSGAITLNSTGSPTTLILDGAGSSTNTIQLLGGGKLTLSDNADNLITANSFGTTLETEDAISGAGTISNLVLENVGLIDANGPKAPLVIINNLSGINGGTMEATAAGGLDLVDNTISNASGTIAAAATGAVVNLENATINGGTVSTVAGSSIVTANGTNSTLNLDTLNNAGTIRINPNSTLFLSVSGVNNSGAIELNATGGQPAHLALVTSVSFEGKGKVILSDNSANLIGSNGAATILENLNNMISGAGTIGDSFMALDNAGTIDGTGKNPLIIAATGSTVSNFGTIESSSAGGLELLNLTVEGEAKGTVKTAASGSHIDLSNSMIEGGSVTIVAGSTLDSVTGTTDILFLASALNNAGTVAVNSASTLEIGSSVDNTGAIACANLLMIDGDISLADKGKVELTTAGARILSDGSPETLTNVANTISGEGQIGDSSLTFNNDAQGVVDANGASNLAITASGSKVLNDGTMEDTGAGGLALDSPLDNEGTIESAGAGGVTISNTIDNNGKLIADKGVLSIAGAPTGTGSLTIGGNGEISFGPSATGIAQNVAFSVGATGTLAFNAAATTTPTSIYDGTISGFGPNDSIDLAGLSFKLGSTTVSTPVFSAGITTITVKNGTDEVQLKFAGNLTGDTFVVGDDGSTVGGTRLTDPVAKTTGTHVASGPIQTLAPVGNDLPLINYAGASNIALLGNYMASMFTAAAGQAAAPMTMETGQSQAVLAHAHTG